MARTLARLTTLLAVLMILMASGTSIALAGAKPPDPYPPELSHGERVGISKTTGEYCDLDDSDAKKRADCRAPEDCQDMPQDGTTTCVGEGSTDPDDARQYELNALKRWESKADQNQANYTKIKAYLEKCVKTDKKTFQQCSIEAGDKWPPPAKTPLTWVAGKVSEMAADALEEAAASLGQSVVWLLKQFADAFNEVSTIELSKTGIGPVMGIMTGLSVIVAAFLLLIQFGKLAVSGDGKPLVTAITGLAKWAVISAVYVTATQVALNWSDTLSTALINNTFSGGGSSNGDASKAMETQLGALFSGLVGTSGTAAAGSALITGSGIAPTAVGFVIVISILCILAIGALWIEMLVRQAGIMILLTMMAPALAGQMSDSTKEWWPKGRNALVALILMKPTIVIVFAIGFEAMSGAEGVRNVIVGLIIFLVAGTSWPVLAKFIVVTSNGDGTSTASGMISSVGSSVSSMFGGNQPSPSGAGTAPGGGNYTRALESENATAADGGGGFWSKAMKGSGSGGFLSKTAGVVGVGLQVAAVGKDITESSFSNAAAHAGLGPGSQGGRHVVVPPRRGGDSPAPAAPSATQEEEPPPPPPPPPSPEPTASSSEGSS